MLGGMNKKYIARRVPSRGAIANSWKQQVAATARLHCHLVRQCKARKAPLTLILPSSDEGRGSPLAPVSRTRAWVTEGARIFPLPFTRGEDQCEGLIRRPVVSLTKWQCIPPRPSSEREREKVCTVPGWWRNIERAERFPLPIGWGEGQGGHGAYTSLTL